MDVKSKLEHLGLETTLLEILYLQSKHKIELHLSLINITNPNQPSQKSISFEQPLLVFLLQVEAIPSGGPDLGQAQPN